LKYVEFLLNTDEVCLAKPKQTSLKADEKPSLGKRLERNNEDK